MESFRPGDHSAFHRTQPRTRTRNVLRVEGVAAYGFKLSMHFGTRAGGARVGLEIRVSASGFRV